MWRTSLRLLLMSWSCADVPNTQESAAAPLCAANWCSDGIRLNLRAGNDAWHTGTYAFEFRFGDVTHVCETALPEGFPLFPSMARKLPCRPELQAYFWAATQCEPEHSDGSAGACTSIDSNGGWQLSVILDDETPDALAVRVERDGHVILERSVAPVYQEIRPNGRECGPICMRSQVELRLNE